MAPARQVCGAATVRVCVVEVAGLALRHGVELLQAVAQLVVDRQRGDQGLVEGVRDTVQFGGSVYERRSQLQSLPGRPFHAPRLPSQRFGKNHMSPLYAWAAAVVVLIVACAIILPRMRAAQRGGAGTAAYEKKPSLLSEAERSFYLVLLSLLPPEFIVCPKVRLSDVLEVKRGTPQPSAHRNRINQKHVDFLICDRQRLAPVLAIELDDRSHQTDPRRARDQVLDKAAVAARLPLLHVPARASYDSRALAGDILPHLSGTPSPDRPEGGTVPAGS